MARIPSTPWHRESFDRFVQERLPQLLSERLPLAGYCVESTDPYACRVQVVLNSPSGEVEVTYTDVPQPDGAGIIEIDGRQFVVPPVAANEHLETAEVRCVGERLHDLVEERLGEAPEDLPWDAALARTWLPLDTWVGEFVVAAGTEILLDDPVENWLQRHTLLRRIAIPDREEAITPGHLGRTCPFETPEGPNISRILTISLGAEIRDGRLIVVDESPGAALGITGSMIPFLEHSDANRLLMGANMMRQWMVPPDPEPALVQTGNEPDAADFWCGRNLLTAFISWDGDAFEDAIAISESCAKRLDYSHPVEPGDKLSNRHGAKGVISRILPDAEMPHLPDGTPVELIYSLSGLPSRMNFGQVREAVMGRIGVAEGKPAIVPPFGAPDDAAFRERLREVGLPETGMEVLTVNGEALERPSTVGWVYWGCTHHVARNKIHASAAGEAPCQLSAEAEYVALCEAGAFEAVREVYNTLAEKRADAEGLAARVSAGPVEQAGPPSPGFADLAQRLRAAGICAELQGEAMAFRFAEAEGDVLDLARPVPHPWLPGRTLSGVGAAEGLPEYDALVEANARAVRMRDSRAPGPLAEKTFTQLEERVKAFFDALLTPAHLQFRARVLFSGRTVIAPEAGLRFDQVGIAEEIAWTLFGPRAAREIGSEAEVQERSERATQALDQVMAQSWVIVYRAPALMPTSFLAFHPVRRPDRTIRLHPLACEVMNADFDGDQAAVFLPITGAGQEEAGERLSLAAHLARDPELIRMLPPKMDAIFGLASLSLSPGGCEEISELAGVEVAATGKIVTRWTLIDALRKVLERDGPQKALEASERLMRRGFEVSRAQGASMGPFFGATLDLPPGPEGDDVAQWQAYAEEVEAWLTACDAFDDDDFGPVNLMWKSGARANVHQLRQYVGGTGVVLDAAGETVVIRGGWREGLTPEEAFARVAGARRGLAQVLAHVAEAEQDIRERGAPEGYGVLARARRSERPGIVFARAADRRECDPLEDAYSRLFVGLSVESLASP